MSLMPGKLGGASAVGLEHPAVRLPRVHMGGVDPCEVHRGCQPASTRRRCPASGIYVRPSRLELREGRVGHAEVSCSRTY